MTDFIADARRYDPNVDEAAVLGIAKHFGIAMVPNTDASFVAASDRHELLTVREKFLTHKCHLDLPDADLDAAMRDVAQQMKGDNHQLRTTFCYLLAKRFDKLRLFGGGPTLFDGLSDAGG